MQRLPREASLLWGRAAHTSARRKGPQAGRGRGWRPLGLVASSKYDRGSLGDQQTKNAAARSAPTNSASAPGPGVDPPLPPSQSAQRVAWTPATASGCSAPDVCASRGPAIPGDVGRRILKDKSNLALFPTEQTACHSLRKAWLLSLRLCWTHSKVDGFVTRLPLCFSWCFVMRPPVRFT